MDNKTGRQAVVIGLDGTPFSFLKAETARGRLPNIAALQSRGTLAPMESEMPAISSVAWASFMTGVNPAQHGIFGFTDRKPGTYDLSFPNYASLRAEPFWDSAGREGKRVCVINVPSTYPARPLNGVLVSGFVAPNLERATYPREAYEYLASSGYMVDVDASEGRNSLDSLLESLHFTLEKRREALWHFWKQERWDLFVCVFTGTDRLHHFLWKHYVENDPVYAPEFMRYYARIDEIVGEIVSELGDDVSLFMLSDHGSCLIKSEVFINAFLVEQGFTSFSIAEPRMISDIDASASRAYCLDPGRIYLNLQGREPAGTVAAAEAEGVIAELTEALGELRDPATGETVIDRILPGRDIYSGDLLEQAPDLILQPKRGYDLKGSPAQPSVFFKGHLTGMHTHDDAFVFIGAPWDVDMPGHIRGLARRILNSIDI